MFSNRRRIFINLIIVAMIALLFWVFVTDKLPMMPGSAPACGQGVGKLSGLRFDGYTPQERVNSIVAFWNNCNGSFWVKGRYDINPLTEQDSIIYEVAIRIDVGVPNPNTQAGVANELNRMLWALVRSTLIGQNEQTVPSYIQIIAYLYIGDAPFTNSNVSYVFPSQNFQKILEETDLDQIITYAGIPKNVVPTTPNIGELWDLPSLIPNK